MTSVNAMQVARMDWHEIDGELRAIAKLRGPIDAREAELLCCASRHEIWRNLGKASFLEYLEEVLGYTPKCARERVRVALALVSMPALTGALANGELHYSAIRELTRVATAETEAEWCEAARGKNVRRIEEMVSVHAPGDLPSDPPKPDLKPRVVRFEISPATFAKLRQVQHVLADEAGGQLDDDALVSALCDAVLDGGGNVDEGRARHQMCSGHHRALHEGALTITGPAPDITVTWTAQRVAMPHLGHASRHTGRAAPAASTPLLASPATSHVGRPSKYERVVMKTEAIQAMTQLGFHKATARSLVEAALDASPHDVTLEPLIRAALQRSRTA